MLGVFNVLKPTGWTSSDVVVKVRHILREYTGDKKIKVGHLGTLDPAGSGVLPVCFGAATKLFDYYVSMDKIYRTTFTFGKSTDTLDLFCNLIMLDIYAQVPRLCAKSRQILLMYVPPEQCISNASTPSSKLKISIAYIDTSRGLI